jgi:hypothetical protein
LRFGAIGARPYATQRDKDASQAKNQSNGKTRIKESGARTDFFLHGMISPEIAPGAISKRPSSV